MVSKQKKIEQPIYSVPTHTIADRVCARVLLFTLKRTRVHTNGDAIPVRRFIIIILQSEKEREKDRKSFENNIVQVVDRFTKLQ